MSRRWSAAEDDLLLDLYERGLPRGLIGERLGRSADAVDARRRALARRRRTPAPSPWSEAEDRFLVAATTARVPSAEIAHRCGRSLHAIGRRRQELGIARPAARRYSPAEDARLASALAEGAPFALLGDELGRSEGALRLRARILGLAEQAPRRTRWSHDEDAMLRSGYRAGLSAKLIHDTLLPGRPATAIVARARLLGLSTYARRWSANEDAQLELLVHGLLPLDAIATALHRSREAIGKRCRVRGLPAPRREPATPRRRWDARADELLRENQQRDTLSLARLIGRSEAAVRRRRKQLGLRPPPRSQHHAPRTSQTIVLGKRRRLSRETPLTPARAIAASRRLELPLAQLQKLARETAPDHAPRSLDS